MSVTQSLIPAAVADEMSEVVTLVEDVGSASADHVVTADALDSPLDGAVRSGKLLEVAFTTVRADVDFPVDAEQGVGTRQFQRNSAIRTARAVRYRFVIPGLYLMYPLLQP